MKIAFTTQDSVHINAHFGWANKIDVYNITPEGYDLAENLVFTGDLKEDGNEDKLLPKLQALGDCAIVYVADIGPSAAARLINKGVTPIKAPTQNAEIADVLDRLVVTLKGSPPPWLRKALRRDSAPNFDQDYTETEEEVTV